ncbi:MAG TPA: hypothetical protein PKI66_03780 [Methanobacteriaceae archaeon]|nr:hypothetical protein [Methanobacteriaceae archaeon]HNS25262.1 hypothetical protein [Methanobacteriaceae archaeon]
MVLLFKEPKTFQTPDKGEYVILPVQVDDMKILFRITNGREKLEQEATTALKKKLKKKTLTKEEKKEINISGEDFLDACGKDIKKLIDVTVINTKTGEPLPLKYRQPGNVMELIGEIMDITNVDKKSSSEGDDTPLELKKTS